MDLTGVAGTITSGASTKLAAKENPNQAHNSAVGDITLALGGERGEATGAGGADERRLRLQMLRQVVDMSGDGLVRDRAGDAVLRNGRVGGAHGDGCWWCRRKADSPIEHLLCAHNGERPLPHRPDEDPARTRNLTDSKATDKQKATSHHEQTTKQPIANLEAIGQTLWRSVGRPRAHKKQSEQPHQPVNFFPTWVFFIHR
jgi:hypothetical protein